MLTITPLLKRTPKTECKLHARSERMKCTHTRVLTTMGCELKKKPAWVYIAHTSLNIEHFLLERRVKHWHVWGSCLVFNSIINRVSFYDTIVFYSVRAWGKFVRLFVVSVFHHQIVSHVTHSVFTYNIKISKCDHK